MKRNVFHVICRFLINKYPGCLFVYKSTLFRSVKPPPSSLSTSHETPANSNANSFLADVSLSGITSFFVLAEIGRIEVKQGDEYSIVGENLVQINFL